MEEEKRKNQIKERTYKMRVNSQFIGIIIGIIIFIIIIGFLGREKEQDNVENLSENYNFKRNIIKLKKSKMTQNSNYNSQLPRSFLCTEKWPGLISGALNQNKCSNCWAYAAASMLSDRIRIKSGGKLLILGNGTLDYIVPESLSTCIKCGNGKCQYGCNSGNYLDDTLEYLCKNGGILKSDLYKYGYRDSRTKVNIICPIHGIFEQSPSSHLNGSGCKNCSLSRGENAIAKFLTSNKIIYESQKTFNSCKYISLLKFDFYISEYNLCVEYDGIQHFIPIDFFGGEDNLLILKKRDDIKNAWCIDNKVNLIRIGYKKLNDIEEILSDVLSKIESSETKYIGFISYI